MSEELGLEQPKIEPPRILIYGVEGIGKTSFGALAPKPVFIQTENGLTGLQDVARFPLSMSFGDVMENLMKLRDNKHDFQTVCIDSLDWLEPMIWQQVCEENNVKSIELAGGGYGKGYAMAIDLWREYLTLLDDLRLSRGMTIVQIAHAQIKRFENPETEPYDRYGIKLQDAAKTSAAGLLLEYSDIVLFANYYVGIKRDADNSRQKDDDKRKRAVGGDQRYLYTQERAAFKAKNRFGLPYEIPFDKDGNYWGVIAQHVPFFSAQ